MAFKMNRDGFTFYTKPESPNTDKHSHAKMVDKGYPKYGHDKGPTKHDDAHMTKTIAKDKKPDFLDLDGDGNKNESMEDAAASNKNKKRPEDEDNFMRQEDDTREDIEDTAPYGLDE